jgi:hypothetical protein
MRVSFTVNMRAVVVLDDQRRGLAAGFDVSL